MSSFFFIFCLEFRGNPRWYKSVAFSNFCFGTGGQHDNKKSGNMYHYTYGSWQLVFILRDFGVESIISVPVVAEVLQEKYASY